MNTEGVISYCLLVTIDNLNKKLQIKFIKQKKMTVNK